MTEGATSNRGVEVDLLSNALSGDSNALQGLAALVSIVAIVPTAIVFIIGQLFRISLMRQENHKYLHSLYNEFLMLELQHPELGIAYSDTAPKRRLSVNQRAQRDTAFDFLTALFEVAFLTYRARFRTHRRSQWRGWEQYIAHYVSRDDYLEWWTQVVLEGDPDLSADEAQARNLSQYDARFEAYMSNLVAARLTVRKAAFGVEVAAAPAAA